jgi:hypothetical protein
MALSLLENTAWGSHRGQVLKNLLFILKSLAQNAGSQDLTPGEVLGSISYLAEQEELVNRESGKVACCTGKINLFLGIS